MKSLALFARGRPAAQPRKGMVNATLKKNLSVPLNKFRDAVNSALKRTENTSAASSDANSGSSSPTSGSTFANALTNSSPNNSTFQSVPTPKFNSLRGKEAKAAVALAQGFNNVATDGIEIQSILIETEDIANPTLGTKGITLSCWDFAGQDVYLTTHQFFLGKRSIYLIGFRLDHPLEEGLSRVEYWLQTIRLRAPNAPIALLGTHLDDYVSGADTLSSLRKSLMDRYKKHFAIVDVFFISNATHEGVHEMVRGLVKLLSDRKQRIKLGIEQQRPVTYMVLAESLTAAAKEMEHPVMAWSDWCKFVQSNAMIHEEADVISATSFLSDVGALLWFNEPQLKDTVVLDCQWLTQVFSSIVTVRTTMIRNGVFRHADLPLLWKQFPSSLHPFMLLILRKFELIYSPSPSWSPPPDLMKFLLSQPNNSGEENNDPSSLLGKRATLEPISGDTSPSQILGGFSIVAPMLPEQSPPEEAIEKYWSSETEESDISRCYTFKFLPPGFFSRLVVRLLNSDWSLRLVWRSAMIAIKEQFDATLYLSYNQESNEIIFSLRGPRSSTQVAPIIDSLNNLMSEWLKEGNVMVSAVIHLSDGTHHKIDVKTLEKYVARGGIFVTISNERIRLDGIVPELAMAGVVEETSLSTADLELGREVGRGAFATVRLGVYKGQEVAIKQLQLKDDKTSSEMFEEFRREVWLMSRLQHENIVRLLGVSLRPEPSMVMEYMNGGHLFSYLHRSGKKIEWDEKMSLAIDVARGMQFIHSTKPPIVHRDLKSPNVLLVHVPGKPFPTAKIADFGLSRGLEWSSHYSDKVVDNPTWLAPEVLRKDKYNEKVDVYAFGVILFELACQKQFFGEITFFHELEEKVLHGGRPPILEEVPTYVRQLIEACWQEDAFKRPDFNMIVAALTSQRPVRELIAAEQHQSTTPKAALRLNASRGKLINSTLSQQLSAISSAPPSASELHAEGSLSPPSQATAGKSSAEPLLTRRRSGRDSLQLPSPAVVAAANAAAGNAANTSLSLSPPVSVGVTPSLTPTDGRSRNSSNASMIDSYRSDDSSSSSDEDGPRSRSESQSSTGSRLRKFSISSALSSASADTTTEGSLPNTPESEVLSNWPPEASSGHGGGLRKRTNAGAPMPAHLSERYRRAVQVQNPQIALQVGARGSTAAEKSSNFLLNTWVPSTVPQSSSTTSSTTPAAGGEIALLPDPGDSIGDNRRNSM